MPKQGCKDCLGEGRKPRPSYMKNGAMLPGQRCYTHYHADKKRKSSRSHELRTQSVYGITGQDYKNLYAAQGGKCAICRKAKGRARRLAVDHEHKSGLVRGLLCSPCNYGLIGRYDIEALKRAIEYLERPPAVKVIGSRIVP